MYPPVCLTTVKIEPGGYPIARAISLNEYPDTHIRQSSLRSSSDIPGRPIFAM